MCQACGMNPLAYNGSTAVGASTFAVTADVPQYGGSGANFWASQGAIGNTNTNGVLSGSKWGGTTLTYSFPTLTSQYDVGYGSELTNGFLTAPEATRVAIRYAMNLVSQYTNLTTTEVDPAVTQADVRVAFSNEANPTAYAYYPANSTTGGDIWYGNDYASYKSPVKGQYAWATTIHELGHSLGLKHGHQTGGVANTAMQAAYDQMAYSIMTYKSYENGPTTGYTNETNGYAQTFMMYDIAALQVMYGANFNTNSGNTTYTWSATTGEMFINGVGQGAPGGNRVFMTVWDGNGIDTYDFSNYTTNMTITLAPGAFSITSATQLAYLGNNGTSQYAPGNVFNALQFNGDVRSLIENANGGSGNDGITGNAADNVLNGNGGADTLTGGAGNDTLNGGSGVDVAVFSAARSNYTLLTYNNILYTLTAGADGKDTLTDVENLQFSDGTVSASTASTFKSFDYIASHIDLLNALGGNGQAGIDHYFNYGWSEGRVRDTFNNYEYLASHSDVLAAFGANQDAAAQHFVQHGFQEGRSRDNFDNLRYTASYNDLISAFGLNQDSASEHYVTYGVNEGRSKFLFDAIQYIASYGDLINAFGSNVASGTQHFIQYGFSEHRVRDNFNAAQYLNNYVDLRNAFGTDQNAATLHYIQYGRGEGRTDHII